MQLDVAAPGRPYSPGGHAPVQLAFAISTVSPYRPAAQLVHASTDPRLNVPAGHCPLQPVVFKRGEAPKRPGAQPVHAEAPARLYRPGGQVAAVLFVLPSPHAYPPVHSPLHSLLLSANALP